MHRSCCLVGAAGDDAGVLFVDVDSGAVLRQRRTDSDNRTFGARLDSTNTRVFVTGVRLSVCLFALTCSLTITLCVTERHWSPCAVR